MSHLAADHVAGEDEHLGHWQDLGREAGHVGLQGGAGRMHQLLANLDSQNALVVLLLHHGAAQSARMGVNSHLVGSQHIDCEARDSTSCCAQCIHPLRSPAEAMQCPLCMLGLNSCQLRQAPSLQGLLSQKALTVLFVGGCVTQVVPSVPRRQTEDYVISWGE